MASLVTGFSRIFWLKPDSLSTLSSFSRLRRIAVNLLQPEQSRKRGMQTKGLKAAWDEGYLLKVLTT
jgi:hypothetical protein